MQERPDRRASKAGRTRTKLGILAVAMTVLVGSVAGPSSAQAAVRPTIGTSSADMFWCTSTQDLCANHPFRTGANAVPKGTPLKMVCWINDRGTRWFYSLLDNGQEGYFWAPQVINQTPNTPSCGPVNWLNAANWAIGHLGQTVALPGDGPYLAQGSSWYLACTAFVYDAWSHAGEMPAGAPVGADVYASDLWNWFLTHDPSAVHLESQGVTRPPRGALVLWANPDRTLWHVAISLGNWQAIGTYHAGSPNNISMYSVYTSGYTGWIMPKNATVPQNPS